MTIDLCFALATTSIAIAALETPTRNGPNPPRKLRVELREDPIAIDDARPRFSFELDDARRGAAQSAYQILVATSASMLKDGKGDLWDSGKIQASDVNGIEYAGNPFVADRTYTWAVRSWDEVGRPSEWSAPSTFTAAPRGDDAWRATWIRAGHAPDAGSIGHKSEIAQAEDAWPWIEFDFGGNVICDKIRLHPARPDGDATKPGVLFPLRIKVYTDQYGKFEDKAIRIGEYSWQDVPNAGTEPLEIEFPRYTLRYLRVVATKIPKDGARGFAMALGEIQVLDGMSDITSRGKIRVSGTSGEPGWAPEAVADGALVPAKAAEGVTTSLPRLRTSFTVGQPIARAIVHASALGAYEMTINGKPVGDARLAPGWTDYTKRVAYQSYDATNLFVQGENVIGVQLAPGWYAGRLGLAEELGGGRKSGLYGTEPAFILQSDILLTNGQRVAVQTDENWRWNRGGPLLTADLFDGETRDERNATLGWNQPLFQGADWRPVDLAPELKPTLFAERAAPIRAYDVRPALSVRKTGPSTHVYDFGQNQSGVVRMRIAGKAGTVVTIRHGEVLDADGKLYTANLRSAAQTDVYTLSGAVDTLEPRFTVHGFRYAEVSGLELALELSSIEALAVGNDLVDAGSFTCSDDTLNRVWAAATASVRSNFVGVPTDSPQRDERLARLGDVQVVTPFALHRFDVGNFLWSWMSDVRGAQTKDGRFADFAPYPYGAAEQHAGSPGCADAGVLVPWELWLRTHDLRNLRSSASSALRGIESVAAKNPDFVWRNARGNDRGDRFDASTLSESDKAKESSPVGNDLFATAFFAHSARITAKMAFVAGDTEAHAKALSIADRATEAFEKTFVKGARLDGDTQAAYALALDFGLYGTPDRAQDFADRLAARIREQGRLTCGMQSAHRALIALSRHGHHDLALELARRKTMPSWGFMVENGATTTWERWDGFVPGRGFQDPTSNSFNSVASASIGEWMVRAIAGIELVDDHADSGSVVMLSGPSGATRPSSEGPPAWSHIRLAPRVTGGLTSASAEHHAITGLVKSGWKLAGAELDYSCTIPPGSSATLDLPAKDVASIALDGKPLSEAKDLKPRAGPHGAVRIELVSGTYAFRSSIR